MNFNKELFKKVEAKEFGESEVLSLGGHELVIMDAREYTSPISQNTSLKVSVDIAGNDEQAGFFHKKYSENTAPDKKWPNAAVRYISLKDEQIAFLKGFITSLERSNPNFKFDMTKDWTQLKNLKIAGQFGLEEYEKSSGEVSTFVRLVGFRSLDKLGEIKIPRVRKLNGEFVDYEDYVKSESQLPNATINGSGEIEVTEDMLPF